MKQFVICVAPRGRLFRKATLLYLLTCQEQIVRTW